MRQRAHPRAAPASGDVFETTAALLAPGRRDPVRRSGGRQPPGSPRDLAAAGGSAPDEAPRRCSCRGATAVSRRRPARAGAVIVPCRSTRAARPSPDIAAITYGAKPQKKGLDRVLAAWAGDRRPGEQLVVAGLTRRRAASGGRAGDEAARRRGPGPVHGHDPARRVPSPAPPRARLHHRPAA